jgi:hypothetical protein
MCPHQKLGLQMPERGWSVDRVKTAVNMEQAVDPRYLVDEATRASYNSQ